MSVTLNNNPISLNASPSRSVREDARPGDEVVLDDGQLSAFDTSSTQGNRQLRRIQALRTS